MNGHLETSLQILSEVPGEDRWVWTQVMISTNRWQLDKARQEIKAAQGNKGYFTFKVK